MEIISGWSWKPEMGRGKSRDTDLPWENRAWQITRAMAPNSKLLCEGEGRLARGNIGIPHWEITLYSPTRGSQHLSISLNATCSEGPFLTILPKPFLPLFPMSETGFYFLHDNLKLYVYLYAYVFIVLLFTKLTIICSRAGLHFLCQCISNN